MYREQLYHFVDGYRGGLTEGPRREGNMLWSKGFQWKIVDVFWLDRHDRRPCVKRRRGSRRSTSTSRICVKCGTRREGNMKGFQWKIVWLDRHARGPQKAWLAYFDLTYLREMWYGYGRTGRTGAYGPDDQHTLLFICSWSDPPAKHATHMNESIHLESFYYHLIPEGGIIHLLMLVLTVAN